MSILIALAAVAAGCMPGAEPQCVLPFLGSLDQVSKQLLDAHNRERALAGVAPLRWDGELARAALSYGPALAASGGLPHSPRATRPGQRENLWRGGARAFLPGQMVASWAGEKRIFRPGVFPAVSATGNWLDVAHYTQMIWPTTTRVGCGVYRTAQWDYLICRYSPPGNIDGKRVP